MDQWGPPSYQNIAYTALTIASIIVATSSAIVSYLNYFGRKPKILPGGVIIQQTTPTTPCLVVTSFEVWNSRQYQIVLRSAAITIPNAKITVAPDGWRVLGNQLIWEKIDLGVQKVRLEKLSYHEFIVQPSLDASTNMDELSPEWPLSVTCFDPLKRKEIEIRSFIKFDKERSVRRHRPKEYTEEEIQAFKDSM